MHPAETFELIVAMFVAVLVLHYVARRLALPPAVALLVGGGALAFLPGLPAIEIDPELVLVLFLPPLLMDGAWYTALAPFRRHLAGILSLAVGAVLHEPVSSQYSHDPTRESAQSMSFTPQPQSQAASP